MHFINEKIKIERCLYNQIHIKHYEMIFSINNLITFSEELMYAEITEDDNLMNKAIDQNLTKVVKYFLTTFTVDLNDPRLAKDMSPLLLACSEGHYVRSFCF